MRVVICDLGMGNLRSVARALEHAATRSAEIVVSRDVETLRGADKIVMPGQGAFRDCARALEAGLGAAIRERIAAGVPFLGICLGLQALFAASEEAPGSAGLGVFAGKVVRLPASVDPETGAPLKIPHCGWNEATARAPHPFLSDAPEHYYFVHSFAVVPDDASLIAATTSYGADFVSAVAKDNVFACQFHPEKSQRAGLTLLERFLAQ